MTHVTKYTNVLLSRSVYASYQRRLVRCKEGQRMMKQIGLCIKQGGHVDMKTYQDAKDGHERADATLYWKDSPHATLKGHRQRNSRAND